MKKVISFLTMCFMLVGMTAGACAQENADSFIDVTKEHFAYDAVQYFYRENVINGVGDSMFAPDEFVTREQFAKMLSIIYDKENYKAEEETFTDVTSNMWSYSYIESVKEYLTGYYPAGGKAFYNPYGRATREDVAYALVKISGLSEANQADLTVLDNYEDGAQISVSLREYVAIAVDTGLMQGYEKLLRPQDGITRAEVATLLFRAIKKPVEPDKPEIIEPEDNKPDEAEKEEIKEPEIKDEESTKKEYNKIETDKILQISGYREEDIKGTMVLEWLPEDNFAGFYAKLKCQNIVWNFVECIISLENVISVRENSIEGYFDFTIEGTVRHNNIKGKIVIEDDILKLNTEEYDYKFIARLDAKTSEKTEEKNEDEPADDKYLWENAKKVNCDIMSYNDDKANGYFWYTYDSEKNISKLDSSFTVGENEYSIELIKEISKSEGNVLGTFSVYCNDESVAENISAKIVNYDANVGEIIEFGTDDGSVRITMLITEKTA